MIARIKNAWLRRAVVIVLALPISLAAIMLAMGEAAIDEGGAMAGSIARAWRGA